MSDPQESFRNIRTFIGSSLAEALDRVRAEFGSEAVILQTQERKRPRWQFWRADQISFEVTAAESTSRPPKRKFEQTDLAVVAAGQRAAERALAELAESPRCLPETGHEAASASPSLQPVVTTRSRTSLEDSLPREPGRDFRPATGEPQPVLLPTMLAQLARTSAVRSADLPPDLFNEFTRLIDNDVEEGLARDLVRRVHKQISTGIDCEPARSRLALEQLIEQTVRCASPISVTPGRRRVIALVGPTGVGKTTTLAKLAANFRLREGVRMGLVTVDTYRIAAVEQLRTYAEIIDLPMKVVTTPREMRQALDDLAGLDLVLIDTAGRSPRDELKIHELKNLLAEANVDEVHLVLSLVSSLRNLVTTASLFAPAGTTSLILTKLDEALGMGSLLSAAAKIPLPLSYLTTGQDVPDDIEYATSRRIARLVLGDELLRFRPRFAA